MDMEAILKKYDIKQPYCSAGVGDGWLPIVDRLMARLIELGWDRDCHQIKEKYGGLRFYIGAEPEELCKAIDDAEAESFKTCEECGAPGELRTGGWLKTLCDEHEKARGR